MCICRYIIYSKSHIDCTNVFFLRYNTQINQKSVIKKKEKRSALWEVFIKFLWNQLDVMCIMKYANNLNVVKCLIAQITMGGFTHERKNEYERKKNYDIRDESPWIKAVVVGKYLQVATQNSTFVLTRYLIYNSTWL